jgi:hypothetical protein
MFLRHICVSIALFVVAATAAVSLFLLNRLNIIQVVIMQSPLLLTQAEVFNTVVDNSLTVATRTVVWT